MGLVYLCVFTIGGEPGLGAVGLGTMLAFSAVAIAGRHSELVRGLLSLRGDDRLPIRANDHSQHNLRLS